MDGAIQVHSRQTVGRETAEQTAVCKATWQLFPGGVTVCYREDAADGAIQTTVTATDERVTVVRAGAVNATMTFTVGKSEPFLYDIGCGAMEMATFATEIDLQTENGLRLQWQYRLYQSHDLISKNSMEITETAPLMRA